MSTEQTLRLLISHMPIFFWRNFSSQYSERTTGRELWSPSLTRCQEMSISKFGSWRAAAKLLTESSVIISMLFGQTKEEMSAQLSLLTTQVRVSSKILHFLTQATPARFMWPSQPSFSNLQPAQPVLLSTRAESKSVAHNPNSRTPPLNKRCPNHISNLANSIKRSPFNNSHHNNTNSRCNSSSHSLQASRNISHNNNFNNFHRNNMHSRCSSTNRNRWANNKRISSQRSKLSRHSRCQHRRSIPR